MRRRVWIVDDSALDADRARRALEDTYEVRVFTDGGSVLETLAAEGPDRLPDVLVLDWMMPGVSGLDVCRYLRQLPEEAMCSIGVLLLTVHQRTEQVVEGLTAGANDFLSKPYAEQELRARVTAMVRSRQLLERAERAEAALLHLLANSPDALLGIDEGGRITYSNDEARAILAETTTTLEGSHIEEVLPQLTEWAREDDDSARPTRSDIELGDRLYAPMVRRASAGGHATRVVSLRDVTLQRRAERRRLDFYSVVAHDLRSPLSSSLLRTELLLDGAKGPLGPEVRTDLIKLQRSLRELIAMINDFLEIARFDSGAMRGADEAVSLSALAQETAEDFEPLAEASKLELALERPESEAWVRGDPRRLKQVLSNLVANAIKFTPERGRIEVRVDEGPTRVECSVTDTGRGIAEDKLPDLFERYSRALDDEHEVVGTGLGLMIVRETVRAHGGDVEVKSVEQEGSTFSFWVPSASGPAS